MSVTYKTAWRMCHEIRHKLMVQDDGPFTGSLVEADETYMGGRRRGAPQGGRPPANHPTKRPVFGIVERRKGGRVMAVTVPNVQTVTLMPHILKRVLPSSTVYTDEYVSYQGLRKLGFDHRRIHHSEKVYVSGDINTNTIEGFWSLVKRGVGGVYHAVSAKHLQGYLNEYAWRYNHRADGRALFSTLLLRAAAAS